MPEGPVPAPLPPGSTIGILGSGQLGRMLAMAGARLGLKTHIYCEESGPAFDVAARTTKGSFADRAALAEFAAAVDAVTYEFENVPIEAARHLAGLKAVRPGSKALEVAQDRLTEKTFIAGLGIPVAPFRQIDGPDDLKTALKAFAAPAILKTRRLGYDGKGQASLRPSGDIGRCLGGGRPPALRAREAHRLCARALRAGGARRRRRDGRLRLPGQHARGRHPAPLRRPLRPAGGRPGAGPPDRGDHRHRARLRRRAGGRDVPCRRRASRPPSG